MAQWWITCLPMQETRVQSLDREDPLEKEMATTALFLPGKSDEQRSLADYNSWDHKRVGHDLETEIQQENIKSLIDTW